MSLLTGTGVAIVTPFDAADRVDVQSLANLVEYQIRGGVSYLVVLGTTGESVTLSSEEQITVIETVFEANAGRVPIILGAGGNNTQATCKKVSTWSEDYQPAGFLSVCPYYNRPEQEGLYQHFASISRATDLPIILYNVPARTSSNLEADTCLRLAHDFQNIVAVKEASGDMSQIMAIINSKPQGFDVLAGDDLFAYPILALGGTGLISVLANAFPEQISNMVSACLENRWETARNIHYKMLPLIRLCFEEGNPAGIKAMLEKMNLCSSRVRLPLIAASSSLKISLEKEMAF